jgi:transcriptional regulator with XRE-family HTH domain
LRDLKSLRLRRGLSQADLSARSGVSEFTISEIEAGKRPNARPSTARKLAAGLGVDVADLYGEAMPSPKEAGPLSPEWAITAPDEQFRHTIEGVSTEHLRTLVLDLVSGYQPQSLEDLAKASPEELHRRVVAFSRARIIGEELERRGEEPPERYVLALKRFQNAMTGGEEATRDQNQQVG